MGQNSVLSRVYCWWACKPAQSHRKSVQQRLVRLNSYAVCVSSNPTDSTAHFRPSESHTVLEYSRKHVSDNQNLERTNIHQQKNKPVCSHNGIPGNNENKPVTATHNTTGEVHSGALNKRRQRRRCKHCMTPVIHGFSLTTSCKKSEKQLF